MSSALNQAGASSSQSKYAPLTMDRYITGLVTQRSPLRDAEVPYLQAKFYSAGRFDSIWDGLNVELSARSTLIRRPGHSVYNSQTFPAISRLYEFHTVVDGSDQVHVMADTAAAVYDSTGPSTKLNIWSKATGGGKTCFQSVGNTLYFSNLLENKKWMLASKAWGAGKAFSPGDFIVDPNNNIQLVPQQVIANVASVAIASGVVTVLLQGPSDFLAGSTVALAGLATATFLNGQNLTLTDATVANGFQAAFAHADYVLASDTGTVTFGGGAAVTGNTEPSWPTTYGTVTPDGGVQWQCWGSSVQNWAIAGPAAAPSVVQAALPSSAFPQWMASTFYTTSLSIVDENGNVQKLTTAGTTGSAEPTWSQTRGGTTQDGTVVWTNVGPAAWIPLETHLLGDIVQVQYTYYATVQNGSPDYSAGNGQPAADGNGGTSQVAETATEFFQCTTAGVSGRNAPAWTSGSGITVNDGTVVWTNIGTSSTWSAIGADAAISTAQRIVDANGNFQNLTTSGKSGTTVPAWAKTAGSTTPDGGALWTEGGSYSAGGTAAWYWGFAYKCSIDNTTSTVSPVSVPLTVGANMLATLQAANCTDPQADRIVIYRTTQGGSPSQLFELDEIPRPSGPTWTYQDTSPDAALTPQLQAAINGTNNPPPVGICALTYHLSRVWAQVGNLLYWCTGPDASVGNGLNAWTASNVFAYPDSGTRLVPVTVSNGGVFVFTVADLYCVFGTGTASNPFTTQIYAAGIGLLNHDALDIIGSTIHLFTSARKQVSLDPSAGYTETGVPIGDQFVKVTTGGIDAALYNPATTYVTWHESQSADTGLFVADGTVGWFRYSAISQPETGFLWAPRAAIQGGTSAVQSIETSPGLRTLLVGPQTSGPILQRDLTVNSDNGQPYASTNVVLGSIQLCQPFEVCEVAGVALDSIRVGTAPTIGILYGEVEPTPDVPWDMYRKTGVDPPLLPSSTTLFNDRFITLQNGKPPQCRHMQLLIQWAAEDAPSELLTHTIYGQKMVERSQQ